MHRIEWTRRARNGIGIRGGGAERGTRRSRWMGWGGLYPSRHSLSFSPCARVSKHRFPSRYPLRVRPPSSPRARRSLLSSDSHFAHAPSSNRFRPLCLPSPPPSAPLPRAPSLPSPALVSYDTSTAPHRLLPLELRVATVADSAPYATPCAQLVLAPLSTPVRGRLQGPSLREPARGLVIRRMIARQAASGGGIRIRSRS